MIKYLIVLWLCISCATTKNSITQSGITVNTSDCVLANATANDGIDDLFAIQTALNGNCSVLTLGPGVWDIATPIPVAPKHRPLWMLNVVGKTLKGSGPSTILNFTGNVNLSD